MNKRINFEDNIYLLLCRIRLIRDMLALDADPEIFLNKTVDDIEFIDGALNSLMSSLLENSRLIERDELLNHLSELDYQFAQVLGDILSRPGTISADDFPAIRDKITITRIHSLERRKKVDASSAGSPGNSGEPVVSSDELNELLREF